MIAGGMESSDSSEDDIVFNHTSSSNLKSFKGNNTNELYTSQQSFTAVPNTKHNESPDLHDKSTSQFPDRRLESNHSSCQKSGSGGSYNHRSGPKSPLNHRNEQKVGSSFRQKQQNRYRNMAGRRQCIDSVSSEMLDDLRYAVTTGNLETTKNILSKGIWVDTILKAGWTGLMYACCSGHSSIVAYFLENKADPNYHKDMYTPLMAVCAARKNEDDLLECCSLLLQYGAKVNAHERHFTTPLMFAAREGYLNIIQMLLDHGAELNVQDNRGKTALAWAAFLGHGQIIKILMEKGADREICDNMGQSPQDLAYENGHNELVSMIQKGNFATQNGNASESSKVSAKTANGVLGSSKSKVIGNSKSFAKVGELELFLSGIGCPDLITIFQEHQLNFHDLLIMDDVELEKVGVTQIGVRKKILEACKSVHKKEWENSSLPNLKQRQYISCPDAVAMMANIAKHLKFISSSVIYVRQQIQSEPRILELAQDSANVHDLIDELEDGLKNVHFLNDEIRFLKLHLEKVQGKHQYKPADFIVDTLSTNTGQRKLFYTVCLASTAIGILAGIFWKNPMAFDSITSIRLKLPFPK